MIKVLIVDDEVMFRIGVKSCINWNEYGYELIGEAADGKQALEIIRGNKPDIVFTDIKMPGMDGLELTRNIMRDFPDIRVVILSCYNDFEYVKEALRLGARDYILKLSMKPSDLIELLIKMRDVINKEKRVMQQENAFKQEFNININKLKEEFIRKLLYENNNILREEFEQKVKNLGLKIQYDHNYVILIKVDDYLNAINVIKDESLFQFAFINISNEIVNSNLTGEVAAIQKGVFICIVSMGGSNEEENRIGINRLIRDINASTKKYLNYSISTGASKSCGDIKEFKILLKEATSALDKGFYEGKEFFDYYREENETLDTKLSIDLEIESKLIEAIETSNRDDAAKALEQIFFKVHTKLAPAVVRTIFKEIIYILNRAIKRYDGNLFEYAEEDPAEKIDRMDTLETIKIWMEDFLDFTLEYINKLKSSSFRNEVSKVMDHIKSNIAQSISLKDAAKIANMSEKYFCLLFKKETGKNFVDYVNDLKIEKAKDLLKNREVRTYEVAQKLGYENEGYFSKIFKKYSGLTPQEYKKTFFP